MKTQKKEAIILNCWKGKKLSMSNFMPKKLFLSNDDKIIEVFIYTKLKIMSLEQKDKKFPQIDGKLKQMKLQIYRKK